MQWWRSELGPSARGPAGRGSADPHRAGALRRRHRAPGHAARGVHAQHRAARAVAVGRRVARRGSCRVSSPSTPARTSPGSPTPRQPGAAIGMHLMPGLHVAGRLRPRHRQGALRRRPDRAGRGRGPLHRRGRARADRRGHRLLDPVVTYEDALDPTRSRRCSTSSTTTSPSGARWRSATSTRAFAKADRVVQASIWVHRHQPVPMECRGTHRDRYDRAAEHLTIHASTQSPHMLRMLLPRPDRRADGEDPRARRRRRRRVRPEERRCSATRSPSSRRRSISAARSSGSRTGSSISPSAARPARRWPTSRPRSPPTACCSASAWTSSSTSAPTRCDPFPGAIFVGSPAAASFQGPTPHRGHRRAAHSRCSATRRPTCRTEGRGRPATSSASACSTSSRASSTSTRSTSVAATTSQRDEPPLAMLTGQPFVARHHPGAARAGGAASSTGTGFRRRQADARARGPVPRASASPRTSRPRRGRRCPARRTARGHHGQRGRPRLARGRRQRRHRHPPAAPRAGPRDDARRRSRPTSSVSVRGRQGASSATPTSRRSRWSAPAAAGRRRWRTARCSTPRASCASKILVAGRGRAGGQRRRPRDPRRRDQRAGLARRSSSRSRELARIVAEEPERLPDGRRHRARR